jgi:hypothetical protein
MVGIKGAAEQEEKVTRIGPGEGNRTTKWPERPGL